VTVQREWPTTILVGTDVGPENLGRIERAAPGARVSCRSCGSPAELTQAIGRNVDIIFADLLPDFVDPNGRLRWAQLMSAGIEVLRDSPAWSAPGLQITNASGVHVPAMSEYIIAMILQSTGSFAAATSFKSTRRWEDRFAIKRSPVAGKVLGILGYGSIGRRVGRLAHALGMRTLAIRRSRDREPTDQYRWPFIEAVDSGSEPAEVLTADALPRVMRESDFLAVTMPLTADTKGMVGAAELALMKPHAFIVNVSRGAIFDEGALIEALAAKRIAGAALDVFAREPPAGDNPLFHLPNVVLTPHISGVFDEYNDIATDIFITNFGRYARGEPLLNLVSAARGY
jgi:phosphoglycerate dehydrogenase-like enzyme